MAIVALMIEWNIQSRAHACQACDRHFADKEAFHTLLYDEKHSYERLDVCETCWTGQFSEGGTDRKGFVSHWVGMYRVPPAALPEPIGKETAESLLRKLVAQNDPSHAGARFILAVMLERKRLLKVKAQINEGTSRVLIYEHGASGDLFQIADPNLHLDQLEEVQRDVAYLLEHGLDTDRRANDETVEASPGLSVVESNSSGNTSIVAASTPAGDAALNERSGGAPAVAPD
jgi:hypothetical protein